MRFFKKLLRWLLAGLLLVYFAAATTMLVVRFWVLPHINDWRPEIELRLSSALGSQVQVGEISASWSGLTPTLVVENLTVRDRQQIELLKIPHAFASVSWRSLLDLDLRLHHMEVSGIDLSVSRSAQGAITVAGHQLDLKNTGAVTLDSEMLAVNWLLGQGRVFVHDATLRWTDHLREAPELVLSNIDIALNNGLFTHHFLVSGALPEELGQRFEFIIKTDHLLTRLGATGGRDAELYFEIQDVEPQALAPWVDLPAVAGRFAARAWIDLQDGRLGQTVLEILGKKIGTSLPGKTPAALFADHADLRLTGLLSDMLPAMPADFIKAGLPDQKLGATLTTRGLLVNSQFFEPGSLALGDLKAIFQVQSKAQTLTNLNISSLEISNPGIELNLSGSWQVAEIPGNLSGQQAEAMGVVDIRANLVRVSAPALHQYLTPFTDIATRTWLRDALTSGEFKRTSLTLKGDLDQFPFTQPDNSGVFRIEGSIDSLTLDYAPAAARAPAWPILTESSGSILIDKLALSLKFGDGVLLGRGGERLAVHNVQANIPDFMNQPEITIDFQTQAQAQNYLGVLRRSPLNEMMGSFLELTQASGNWSMPLNLQFPLSDPEKVKVKGQLVMADSTITVGENQPRLESLNGAIDFTNTKLTVSNLGAKFLGGDLLIQGALGESAGGIQIEGTAVTAEIKDYAKQPALSVITGRTKYRAKIAQNNKEGVDILLTSSLEGLALALPAPLGKAAETPMPLTFRWTTAKQRKDYRHSVSLSLADILNARLEKTAGLRATSFFTQAAFAMGTTAQLPPKGMTLLVALDEVNWNDWSGLLQSTTAETKDKTKSSAPIFPTLDSVSLRTPRLMLDDSSLTDLTISAAQAEKGKWQATLRSKETEGTVSWQQASGALAGLVQARFSKLAVGGAVATAIPTEPPKVASLNEDQWSDIPAIDLTIDDFTLYGSRLGSLHLRGANIERGVLWNIESLEVKNPFAEMKANGQWRLKGGNRGILVDTNITISDLGKLSAFMGYPDRVREGAGTLKAKINWINFPWEFSYEGMNGKAEVKLEKGIFEHVNSRSARLLELLSLQSLQRILSLNFRPGNEFKDGFPWSAIEGNFEIEQGVASTMNLAITSPVASINMIGSSDLNEKVWNMDAAVKPRFDMSGTAVATGFVVNPLVGISALVTQFLLRNPIEKAMTVNYQVRGPWDDPTLEPIESLPAVKKDDWQIHNLGSGAGG